MTQRNNLKSSQVKDEDVQKNFKAFVIRSFETLNPGTDYVDNWHVDLICEHLRLAEEGKMRRLIINLPPRSLKSHIISAAWPAWLLAQNPSTRIICTSYSMALSVKFSLDTKIIMESEWYQELFPHVKIFKRQNEKKKFMTKQHGFRLATSVGGTLIGEGGEFLIVDDPHHPNDLSSKRRCEKVFEWFEKSFMTRLNNKRTGVIIVVMQRLLSNDLTGYLLEKNSHWNLLKIPFFAEETLEYIISGRKFVYKKGELLQKHFDDIEQIQEIRSEFGEYNFATLYQQNPLPQQGNIIRDNHILYYDHVDNLEYSVQSWDTAIQTGDGNDYSVCTTWGVKSGILYLLDIWRAKVEYPELIRSVINLYEHWKPNVVLIENKATAQALVQELKNTAIPVIPREPKMNKEQRLITVSGFFDSHKIMLPRNNSLTNQYVSELMSFPRGKYDDQVDSTTQFLHYMRFNNIGNELLGIRRI